MDDVTARELQVGARIADALVYAAGLAGIVAGGLLLRAGEMGFAIVAWALTFVAGGSLRLAAAMARALAQLLVRTRGIEEEVDRMRQAGGPPDPEGRWGRWHG
jgi:hypothetical protein